MHQGKATRQWYGEDFGDLSRTAPAESVQFSNVVVGDKSLARGISEKESGRADPLHDGQLVNYLRCSLFTYRFRILEKQNWLPMSQIFSPLLALISRCFCFSRILQSEATSPYWRRPQTDHATPGFPRSEAWPRRCSVSHIIVMSLGRRRISWLFFKAVRAGLAVGTSISKSIREERVRRPPDGKTANRPRPRDAMGVVRLPE
jgi:hypothetical protein